MPPNNLYKLICRSLQADLPFCFLISSLALKLSSNPKPTTGSHITKTKLLKGRQALQESGRHLKSAKLPFFSSAKQPELFQVHHYNKEDKNTIWIILT